MTWRDVTGHLPQSGMCTKKFFGTPLKGHRTMRSLVSWSFEPPTGKCLDSPGTHVDGQVYAPRCVSVCLCVCKIYPWESSSGCRQPPLWNSLWYIDAGLHKPLGVLTMRRTMPCGSPPKMARYPCLEMPMSPYFIPPARVRPESRSPQSRIRWRTVILTFLSKRKCYRGKPCFAEYSKGFAEEKCLKLGASVAAEQNFHLDWTDHNKQLLGGTDI